MPIKDIDKIFLQYVDEITENYTSDTSLIVNQYTKLDELMEAYGIDNQQKSMVVSELTKAIITGTGDQITSAAIELLKIRNQEKFDELKLKILAEDLAIKKTEAEIAKVKLEQAKLELAGIECKNKLLCAQADTEAHKQQNLDADTDLKRAEKATEVARTALTKEQTKLVDRQRRGYGDNLLVKAAEFKGGLASFAMNSAPENPTTGNIVNAFNQTVAALEGRSGW